MTFDPEQARRTLAIARDPETVSPHDYHAQSACLDLLEEACGEVESLRRLFAMANETIAAVARNDLARIAKLRAALEFYAVDPCSRARAALKEDET